MDRDDGRPEPALIFLVERYWPGIDEPTLRAMLPRLDEAGDALAAEGLRVANVGSILMPADQVVFSLFSAPSEIAVRRVNELAGLPVHRIATAIAMFGPDDDPTRLEVRT